jgi:HSP20 family protein
VVAFLVVISLAASFFQASLGIGLQQAALGLVVVFVAALLLTSAALTLSKSWRRPHLSRDFVDEGRFGEGERVLGDVVLEEVADTTKGGNAIDPRTEAAPAARAQLAVTLAQSGAIGEAIEMYRQLLTDQRRLLGEDHPVTLATQAELAGALGQSGSIEEAIEIYRQLVTDRRRLLGEDYPLTLGTRPELSRRLPEAGETEAPTTTTAFNPFSQMDRRLAETPWGSAHYVMPMDLYRDAETYVARIDLPGVDPASIDIDIEDRTLTIRAQRAPAGVEGAQWLSRERATGTFARQLSLGTGLALDQVSADYSNGVLSLTIPVHEESITRESSPTGATTHPFSESQN